MWPVLVWIYCFAEYCILEHEQQRAKWDLKLYCRYLYTRPYMINRIWSLKQLWLQVNGHAWFIYMGSADLFGTGRDRNIQKKIYVSSGIRTHTAPVHDRKVSDLDRSAMLVRYEVEHYSLTVFWNGYVTIPVWIRLWFDTQCKVL